MAFTALVRRHHSAVRVFLRRVSGDDALADDLAQETFVKAHAALHSWRGDGSIVPWLMGIAWRCFLSERRKVRHTREHGDNDAADRVAAPRAHERTSRDVQRALQQLSDDERVCIALCFQEELTHDEAARVLGMPLGTLKSHVARGKTKLRTLLHAYATSSSPEAA